MAKRKFHRWQKLHAGTGKRDLCLGLVVTFASYPPPNAVTQLRERRRIEKLLSKFTALAAKLLRIPSHEVGIHQCVDLMVRRSQGNESADRFYGIDSLHMEMVDYTSPRVKTESGSNPQF
ncbi:MAG: hypothetical protein WA776_12195 [Xanthobacteraceae bacterium]